VIKFRSKSEKPAERTILFVCIENAGRSQIAEGSIAGSFESKGGGDTTTTTRTNYTSEGTTGTSGTGSGSAATATGTTGTVSLSDTAASATEKNRKKF
jgi:protein-tyrosine-phosphatase